MQQNVKLISLVHVQVACISCIATFTIATPAMNQTEWQRALSIVSTFEFIWHSCWIKQLSTIGISYSMKWIGLHRSCMMEIFSYSANSKEDRTKWTIVLFWVCQHRSSINWQVVRGRRSRTTGEQQRVAVTSLAPRYVVCCTLSCISNSHTTHLVLRTTTVQIDFIPHRL